MGQPSGPADDPGFPHGDCRDTALGTLLRLAGVAHPEDLLLGGLTFEITVDRGVAEGLTLSHRAEDPVPPPGIRVTGHRPADLPALHRLLREETGRGRALGVTVDQYGYEPAPFHGRAHVPHDLVVTAATGEGVEVRDSFPPSRFTGRVGWSRFDRWADSPHLGTARYRSQVLEVAPGAAEEAAGWLARTWRDRIGRNVAAMLAPGGVRGVAAIEAVADRLAEWLADPGHEADPDRRRELPVSSFTDLGAMRRGHAHWLDRVAGLGHPALGGCADRVRTVSRQWDVVASLWLAGGRSGAGADPAALDLAARALHQVPRLVRLIAAAERRVAEQLDSALRSAG